MRSRIFFGFWLILIVVLGALLARLHAIPLPQPTIAALPAIQSSSGWTLTHILAPNCPCSGLIGDHLLARGPMPGTCEKIWILGSERKMAGELAGRGFHVTQANPDELAASSGIQGGPWLLIHAPSGKLCYSGGYAPRPLHVAAEAQDLELLALAKKGKVPAPWASFGCATAPALQRTLDPLRFKY